MTPHLDRHSTTDPKPEMISAVSSGNRIQHDERNVCGIEHAYMFRKDDVLGKNRSPIKPLVSQNFEYSSISVKNSNYTTLFER